MTGEGRQFKAGIVKHRKEDKWQKKRKRRKRKLSWCMTGARSYHKGCSLLYSAYRSWAGAENIMAPYRDLVHSRSFFKKRTARFFLLPENGSATVTVFVTRLSILFTMGANVQNSNTSKSCRRRLWWKLPLFKVSCHNDTRGIRSLQTKMHILKININKPQNSKFVGNKEKVFKWRGQDQSGIFNKSETCTLCHFHAPWIFFFFFFKSKVVCPLSILHEGYVTLDFEN